MPTRLGLLGPSGKMATIAKAKARRGLVVLGVLALITGLGSAEAIWRAADRAEEQGQRQTNRSALPLATSDSARQTREVEIYYGKTGVLAERWREELSKLSHGKPLANLIAVLSSVAALGCFTVALRLQ